MSSIDKKEIVQELTVSEAREYFKNKTQKMVSASQLRRLCAQEKLKSHKQQAKNGPYWMITIDSLDNYIELVNHRKTTF